VASEEALFLREVLKEGRSLIVVQTESPETVKVACEVLDRLGLGIQGSTPARMQAVTRTVGDVVVLDISGRITLGEGNVALREIVRGLSDKGHKSVVMNLSAVQYVDSSGIGELVKAHTTLRNQGGQLKLTNLSKRVQDLLQVTHLHSVFEIYSDEQKATASFNGSSPSRVVA
jgi:anti-sigma B factor antagonist